MSLLKNWKLMLAAAAVAMFTACAGSNGGSDDDYDDSDSPAEASSAKKAAPKEKIDENKLKKTEQEATAITEENHKLRKEIFDAKNKLGISTATD
ncbi:MAG: hypothetical protein MJZ26_14915, partial [Fibrobacter sp.]|nr:hypothetical protein [Fibrobacter sp.]